eukprot:11595532-Alexandrium_andersonii.AAC.1
MARPDQWPSCLVRIVCALLVFLFEGLLVESLPCMSSEGVPSPTKVGLIFRRAGPPPCVGLPLGGTPEDLLGGGAELRL